MTDTKDRFLDFVVNLPRIVRISIVAFFALMLVATVFPLIDHVYLRYFFSPDSAIVPSLVTLAIGGIFYVWGWFSYVGTVGTTPSARNAVLWYFVIGGLLTIIVFGLLIYGIYDLNVPIEAT